MTTLITVLQRCEVWEKRCLPYPLANPFGSLVARRFWTTSFVIVSGMHRRCYGKIPTWLASGTTCQDDVVVGDVDDDDNAWLLSSLPSSRTNVTKGEAGAAVLSCYHFAMGWCLLFPLLLLATLLHRTKTNVADWTANCAVQSNKVSVQWLPLASPSVDPIATTLTKDHWALW